MKLQPFQFQIAIEFAPGARAMRRRWQPRLDAAGAWASIACGVHCALLPLLLAFLPGLGLEAIDSPAFDRGFVAFVLVFGLLVIGSGFSPRRIRLVLSCYGTAAVLLLSGAFAAGHGLSHAVLLSLGGACMASAHLVNRHAVRHHGGSQSFFASLAREIAARRGS